MLRRLLVLVLVLLPSANAVLAHEDFYRFMDFDNIKVRIRTGHEYEEINKVAIIGELTRRLTESMGYQEPVLLDCLHAYGGTGAADHFISFGDGAEPDALAWGSRPGATTTPHLKSPGIVIKQVSESFDVATTLKLVEYAVSHVAEIKRDQRMRKHQGNYSSWWALSIAKGKTVEIVAAPVSPAIEKVWKKWAIRPRTGSEKFPGINYCFKDGKYVVYYWSGSRYQRCLLSLDDIYDFQKVSSWQAIVFDTAESFYYVAGDRYGPDDYRACSKRHFIEDTDDYYRPYEALSLGRDKIAICFSYLVGIPPDRSSPRRRFPMKMRYRALIYRPEQDDLVQDLDELLEKR